MTDTTALAGAPMDGLDRLANDAFAGRVVRKDLVRQVKVGANVPVYVLEFLLGRYCASDDPAAIATGLAVVNQTLQDNFIRPDESEKAKAELKRKGKHRLIDKVDVRLVPSEDKFWAHLANFGDKYVNIPEDVVYKYDRLLGGGSGASLTWSTASPTTKPKSGPSTSRPSGRSRSPPSTWASTRQGAPDSAATSGSTS